MDKMDISDVRTFGIDIDGVLRDFVASCAKQYPKSFPEKEFSLENIDYDLWKHNFPFDNKEDFWYWFSVENSFSIFGTAPQIKKNVEDMNRFCKNAKHQLGIESKIVTYLIDKSIPATYHWLGRTACCIKRIVVTDSYAEKVHFVDAMIDDNVEVLREFKKAGKIAIRYAQPWNEELAGDVDMYHVSSLEELYGLFNVEKELI